MRESLKSFTNTLKSYEQDQQRASNIGITKSVRAKKQVLTYQPEQRGHFTVAKEWLQALEVD